MQASPNHTVKRQLLVAAGAFVVFVLLRRVPSSEGALACGFYCAALFLNFGNVALAVSYLAGCAGAGWATFFVCAAQAVLLIGIKLLYEKKVGAVPKLPAAAYVLAVQLIFLAVRWDVTLLPHRLLCVAAGECAYLVSRQALRALFVRGLRYRLAADEWICVCAVGVCLVFGAGTFSLPVPVLPAIASFCILFGLHAFGIPCAFVVAMVFGVGSALSTGELSSLAVFAVWAAGAAAFRTPRALGALAVVVVNIALSYLFPEAGGSVAELISPLAGALAFFCVPKRVLGRVNDRYGVRNEQLAARQIVNGQRKRLGKKLFELSEVFFQMQSTFCGMVRGALPPEQAKVSLSRAVCEKVCHDCPSRQQCWRIQLEQTEKGFLSFVEAAMHRGKATILDVPQTVTSRCKRTANLLSQTNAEVAAYRQYYSITSSADNGKLLIGEQLGGVSQIFKDLAMRQSETLSFLTEQELRIAEALTYHGVLVKEVVAYFEEGVLRLTAVVAQKDCDEQALCDVVGKTLGFPVRIAENEAVGENWVSVSFGKTPQFEVTCGFATRRKEGSSANGDTHTFLRITEDRVLLALCDGMGSGEEAERVSNNAISLVENFYKAGFDDDLILSSVNRLMSVEGGETFTAVDLCVVNLFSGNANFIKIGAANGLLRHEGEVQVLQAGALPMGVLEEMRPLITRAALASDDLILLASDGVMDRFSVQEVALLLQGAKGNPQEIADEILQQALSHEGVADDMTVLVARVS